MSVVAIQIGVPFTMVQNIPYATPSVFCQGFCNLDDLDLQVAMTPDTATLDWLDLAPAGQGDFYTAAPFIRTTNAAGRTVIFKRATQ